MRDFLTIAGFIIALLLTIMGFSQNWKQTDPTQLVEVEFGDGTKAWLKPDAEGWITYPNSEPERCR